MVIVMMMFIILIFMQLISVKLAYRVLYWCCKRRTFIHRSISLYCAIIIIFSILLLGRALHCVATAICTGGVSTATGHVEIS